MNSKVNSYSVLKRWLDVIFSVVLLFSLLPVFIFVALLVWVEDRGFPIYRQLRAGRNHHPFVIYKFRSMKLGTREMSTEEMQKQGIQPYTKVGNWLRKTSLDELPQLWNIVCGDMSFIGPRPALLTQAPVLNGRKNSNVYLLHPGLTGLAQVKGRDNLSDAEKVAFDLEYLKNFGARQDVNILLLTAKALLKNTGNK